MNGISVWLFSKMVMLIFLFLTFAMIVSYMKMLNERVASDAAEALAAEIKNTVQAASITSAVSTESNVPLSPALPEPGWGTKAPGEAGRLRSYTILVSRNTVAAGDMVSVAVAWGIHDEVNPPQIYTAAAFTFIDPSIQVFFDDTGSKDELLINSESHRIFKVKTTISKGVPKMCIMACDLRGACTMDPAECD